MLASDPERSYNHPLPPSQLRPTIHLQSPPRWFWSHPTVPQPAV